jgi:hypothetical protein
MSKHTENLINWKTVSRLLAGNDTSIRKYSCPAKYAEEVETLKKLLNIWEDLCVNGKPSKQTIDVDLVQLLGLLK